MLILLTYALIWLGFHLLRLTISRHVGIANDANFVIRLAHKTRDIGLYAEGSCKKSYPFDFGGQEDIS